MSSDFNAVSRLFSSRIVLLTCKSTPQKLSFGTVNSTTIPFATPWRDSGAARTLASAVCAKNCFPLVDADDQDVGFELFALNGHGIRLV